jgi:sorbitol-specific phosphotransferase system component IIC
LSPIVYKMNRIPTTSMKPTQYSDLSIITNPINDIVTPQAGMFPHATLNRCETYLGLAFVGIVEVEATPLG